MSFCYHGAARSDLGWFGLGWSEEVEAAAGNVRVGRMTVYKQGSGITGVSKELLGLIVE